MKTVQKILLPLFMLAALAHSKGGEAEAPAPPPAAAGDMPAFRAGAYEVELRSGAQFSFLNNGFHKPVMDSSLAAARFGWMLNDVHHSGLFRGNSEFLIEAFGTDNFRGPGHFMAGAQGIWRYNFVQPAARVVPYFEVGSGGLYNDIYHHHPQTLIGEGFEFVLHSGVGARWMINDRWAVSIEGDYRHVSNAGLARRNQGLNSAGCNFGINWLF